MIYLRFFAVTLLATFVIIASAQTTDSVISESRDASIAYIGTANFVVGRVGRDCLAMLGRTGTPQTFVAVWQQRNTKYLMATQKYMDARFKEAEVTGGVEMRNAIMSALAGAVRSGAESIVKSWLDHPDKEAACKSSVAIIESGAYDFSPTSPMYGELESLVAWAQR